MKYLEAVAARDVALLREKEVTYQGSWKRAGGRSAWFMLRRNMDRLLTMMAPPKDEIGFSIHDLDDAIARARETDHEVTCDESVVRYLRDCFVSEDIFAKITENPEGDDGTVLACVRDLRCYLILVEAEMMARGEIVSPEHSRSRDTSTTTGSEGERFVGKPVDVFLTAEQQLYPWMITIREHETMPNFQQSWYVRRGDFYFLEEYVENAVLTEYTEQFYFSFNNVAYLRLEKIPAELRETYRYMSRELNDKEYQELPRVWRNMYSFGNDTKWHLRVEFRDAWGRDT